MDDQGMPRCAWLRPPSLTFGNDRRLAAPVDHGRGVDRLQVAREDALAGRADLGVERIDLDERLLKIVRMDCSKSRLPSWCTGDYSEKPGQCCRIGSISFVEKATPREPQENQP
jgi:hypothetical protein